MKYLFLYFFLTFSFTQAQSQDSSRQSRPLTGNFNDDALKLPRVKKDYQYPGSYQIVGSLTKSKIYNNDTTYLNIYISGYGHIGNAKMFYSVSGQIFKPTSTMHSSLIVDTITRKGQAIFDFGSHVDSLNTKAITLTFKGANLPGWGYPTSFFDINDDDSSSTVILTENSLNPPVLLKLYSKDDLSSGDYYITLCLTYFNGKEWKTSNQILPVHVNTFFENYPAFIPTISVIALIIAGLALFFNIRGFYINFILRERQKKTAVAATPKDEQAKEESLASNTLPEKKITPASEETKVLTKKNHIKNNEVKRSSKKR
ncbi:MAG: hypothetical protein JST63_00915 [Bacteroidetes bacterium]|nr:hypothetical protein [Bacteroidota bacterium]